MSTLLVREPVSVQSDRLALAEVEELLTSDQLAKDANQLLGYNVRLLAPPEDQKKIQSVLRLKAAMEKLDIRPFNRKTTERYKKQKANRINWRIFYEETVLPGLCVLLGILALLSLAGLCTLLARGGVQLYWWLLPLVSGCASIVCGIARYRISPDFWEKFPAKVEWSLRDISSFEGTVPDYALQTALDLKRACPKDVEILIEYLKVISVPNLDPFLVARDAQGNLYYLEVWNEPGFSRKREI